MIVVRGARFQDFPTVREYDEFLGDRRLDMQRGELLVADFRSDHAVGFLRRATCEFLGWPSISIVCVAEAYRRRGIATGMIRYALETCPSPCVYLTTEDSNAPMQRLASKLGGVRVGYIDGFNSSGEREIIFRFGQRPALEQPHS